MKFSELWLREWVNPAIDSDALANQITMAGLEVDGVEPVAGARCLSPVVLVVMACIPMRLTVMSVALIRHCSTKRWNVRPVC